MTFGEDSCAILHGISKEDAKKIFDSFVNKGGNFIDSVNAYQKTPSEKYIHNN
jgi:aryl-alcohol dehydrogenase-like predicted oxidoreductase